MRASGKALAAGIFFLVALCQVQAWDDADGRARAAELKDHALKYAVENYGGREYFASTTHCTLPKKGERLDIVLAPSSDPGRGYRCTYRVMLSPADAPPITYVTWSRSPELLGGAR